MRSSIFGVVLGAILVALLFWASSMSFHPTLLQKAEARAALVGKGFVGAEQIGRWEIACAQAPVMLAQPKPAAPSPASAHQTAQASEHTSGAADSDSTDQTSGAATPSATIHNSAEHERQQPPAKPVSLGRCRTTIELGQRNRQGGSGLSLSFRYVGEKKALTAFVRFPPIGRGGEMVLLGVSSGTVKLPVTGCTQALCFAMQSLNPAAAKAIMASPGAVLVLPPGPRGQRAKVQVPFFALSTLLDAMHRAEG